MEKCVQAIKKYKNRYSEFLMVFRNKEPKYFASASMYSTRERPSQAFPQTPLGGALEITLVIYLINL